MENTVLDDNNFGAGEMAINAEIRAFLSETAKWAKFLSIVGFVMIGLFLVIALAMSFFMGSVISAIPDAGPLGSLGGGFIGIIYVVMGVIYFFPINYLYGFARKMKIALRDNDEGFLTSSFENLKSSYKFIGIFMAVILGFYLLIILFTLVSGGAAAILG